MPSILFVKTSSLGDVVHNCPAASDVARHFPGAEIDWVVEESFAGVAALHPAVLLRSLLRPNDSSPRIGSSLEESR